MRLTDEVVGTRLEALGFKLLSPYVGGRAPHRLACSHGHEWDANIGNVLKKNGTGCPHCHGTARLTLEVIEARLHPRGIKMLSDNTRALGRSEFECSEGHKWTAKLGSTLEGNGCRQCRSNRPLTVDEVNNRIADRGYVVVGEFKNAGTRATFRCAESHEWEAIPDNVLRGKGCPHCAGRIKYTAETLNEKIKGRGVELVGEYVGANDKANFKCVCGNEWAALPGAVVAGHGCPKCAAYGFQGSEVGYFYTIHIFSKDAEYVGFGITGHPDRRIKTHERNIWLAGFEYKLLDLFHFDVGSDAKALEDLVKETMPIVDTGIQGFIREAIPADRYLDLLALFDKVRVCA